MFIGVFANVIFQSHMEVEMTADSILKMDIIEQLSLLTPPVKTFQSVLWALLKRAKM